MVRAMVSLLLLSANTGRADTEEVRAGTSVDKERQDQNISQRRTILKTARARERREEHQRDKVRVRVRLSENK